MYSVKSSVRKMRKRQQTHRIFKSYKADESFWNTSGDIRSEIQLFVILMQINAEVNKRIIE